VARSCHGIRLMWDHTLRLGSRLPAFLAFGEELPRRGLQLGATHP